MCDVLNKYSDLDLRCLFATHAQNEDVETNPFNLADINCNYYDVHHNIMLPDKSCHIHFQ